MDNVTFIIPARIDSDERLSNLDFCVAFLQKNFNAKIIIIEEDSTSKIEDRYVNLRHVFIKSLFPIFQRTRLTNYVVNEFVDTDNICLYDMDVFLDPDKYVTAVEHLKEYSVVYPFNGKFYEIPTSYSKNTDLHVSDIKEEDKVLLNDNAIGAMVFFRTIDFIRGGMENENFLGWGYEDNERYLRFKGLGFRILKMQNEIYHFAHPRGDNSSGTNPNVNKNTEECDKVANMTKDELLNYISNSFYWCKKRVLIPLSVIIPTYEAKGRGAEFVKRAIDSVLMQSFHFFRVIISDHSFNDAIKNAVEAYNDDRLFYIRNRENRGSSTANLNVGIDHGGSHIIKPMFHDDYFNNTNALEYIHNAFVDGVKWMVVGSNNTTDMVTFSPPLVPVWNNQLVYGRNTMGSPSTVAYMVEYGIRWDETMLWLIDVKFFWEMALKNGQPHIDPRLMVTTLGHKDQLTETISASDKQAEVDLMKKMFPQ